MAKVTYTKGQLDAFTVKEMKTLPLFSKIDPKGLNKADIVKAMLKVQKAEKVATQAQPETKKEPQPIAKEVKNKTEKVKVETVEEIVVEVEEVPSSEKPIFHRPLRGRNPMNFKLN